jgi:hypothetical protein
MTLASDSERPLYELVDKLKVHLVRAQLERGLRMTPMELPEAARRSRRCAAPAFGRGR